MRSFRKGLVFLFVDVAIIIGIFVLQFRTDSSIVEKFGRLQLSLESSVESSDSEENITTLSNKLQVNYNGLSFHSDNQNCAKIILNNGEAREVKLYDWEKLSDLSFKLSFSDDVALSFVLSDDTPNAALSINAEFPKSVSAFYLPFNYSYSMKVLSEENGKIILDDKKTAWNLSLPAFEDGYIHFSHNSALAHYAVHDNTKKFTFDDLTEVVMADTNTFRFLISDFKNNLIASVKTTLSDSSISEQSVVSYIAAMAENGKYQQALDDIPQSFKRGNQRTYLSAPYLNNLVNMNKTLESELKEKDSLISKSAYSDSLEIFTVQNIAAFFCAYKDSSTVKRILDHAANSTFENATIAQMSGIIKTYCNLVSLKSEYASILKSCIPLCIEKITEACTFENNVLVISENGTFLSVIQAAETGTAIMRYGILTSDEVLIKAGRVIISSYISESSAFDARTLSSLYPIIAYDNWYYPHFELINNQGNSIIWAWTCAKSISYTKTSASTVEYKVDFPENLTHYIIFKGIQKFDTIYLYNMAFRTDPRFETYNSSGYVYQKDTETLLLKSRHKTQFETVRTEVLPEKPAATPKRNDSAAIEAEKKSEETESPQAKENTVNGTASQAEQNQ